MSADRIKSSRLWTTLVFSLSLLASTPASAQDIADSQGAKPPKFALSASVHDILPQEAAQKPAQSALANPRAAMLPMVPQPPLEKTKIQPGQPLAPRLAQNDDDRPNAFLEEYQVNWGPWMGDMASRWHSILKDAELVLGWQFHTPRPALIQFTCYADGRIGNVVLRQSSGIPVYDKLQLASLMETAPLAPFPPGTARKSVTLIQGWESHPKRPGEEDFQAGSFASRIPQEKVSRWVSSR